MKRKENINIIVAFYLLVVQKYFPVGQISDSVPVWSGLKDQDSNGKYDKKSWMATKAQNHIHSNRLAIRGLVRSKTYRAHEQKDGEQENMTVWQTTLGNKGVHTKREGETDRRCSTLGRQTQNRQWRHLGEMRPKSTGAQTWVRYDTVGHTSSCWMCDWHNAPPHFHHF